MCSPAPTPTSAPLRPALRTAARSGAAARTEGRGAAGRRGLHRPVRGLRPAARTLPAGPGPGLRPQLAARRRLRLPGVPLAAHASAGPGAPVRRAHGRSPGPPRRGVGRAAEDAAFERPERRPRRARYVPVRARRRPAHRPHRAARRHAGRVGRRRGRSTGRRAGRSRGERAVVVPSMPQRALPEQVDAMVHDGGGNSFTECLRAGVPAVVLPFSSDQFSVARDAERAGAGVVLDPNTLSPADVPAALGTLWRTVSPRMPDLAAAVRWRELGWAAGELLAPMSRHEPTH
ncbi:glycosyltransferase [Streptomyces sp. NPDC127069]|uniref:glycosyltransferase n=1 Tax=Streptomyces sp. NPDC127069 TaxID=3347128 RepID=UPI00364985DB